GAKVTLICQTAKIGVGCLLIFSTLHGANIREISEIAKIFPVFNIVPQIAQMNTDFSRNRIASGVG
ncbi:hypothetical protein, partial [Segatella copri]|uniref:hypothetical protein n=1 Tax=Segatella copri TaxID=165179 RepID=UPI001D17BD39